MRVIAEFDPIDGLTFRDARPFQAGESFVSSNLQLFPPSPAPFYSIVRGLIRPRDRTDGQSGPGARVEVRAFGVSGKTSFLPAPLDLHTWREPGDSPRRWAAIAPNREGSLWAAATEYPSSEPPKEFQLSVATWERHLRDELHNQQVSGREHRRASADFYRVDRRVGIRLLSDRRQVDDEGGIYNEEVMYLDREMHFRMLVDVSGPSALPDLKSHGPLTDIVKLGGESRRARVKVRLPTEDDTWFSDALAGGVKEKILRGGGDKLHVKLHLLTPAIFSANMNLLRAHESKRTPAWRPFWLTETSRHPPFEAPYKMRLVGAIIGKAVPLGFWDTDRDAGDRQRGGPGTPKPLYRCVPAGAVYFLELAPSPGVTRESALDAFFDRFWTRSMLVRGDFGPDGRKNREPLTYFGKMGFGLTVIGGWKYVDEYGKPAGR